MVGVSGVGEMLNTKGYWKIKHQLRLFFCVCVCLTSKRCLHFARYVTSSVFSSSFVLWPVATSFMVHYRHLSTEQVSAHYTAVYCVEVRKSKHSHDTPPPPPL